ncbi:MAG: Gfo/Idh/MocA family oxidoreductase [Armatimonadetes bacterium]|nr:Gfo/Idh/MocA family oxidoreductase [Armatimonadota bacterium]
MPTTVSTEVLELAVVGVGLQGEGHVKCYDAIPNARVVAVCDANAQRAADVGARFGAEVVRGGYEELFAREDIDAVSIALPDHLHRDAAEKAFAAGKHVLLEKPLATTVEDAQAIVAAQKASGKKLMVNWSNRWMLAFSQTKEALESGALGDPLYCYARLNNTLYVPTKMLSWSANTQLPHWLICHRLDIARWYFGSEATRVTAVRRYGVLRDRGIDTPDLYQATIEFANGCVGNFESCWILPESLPWIVDSKFQLICTQGYANIDPLLPAHVRAGETKYEQPGYLAGDVMGEPTGFVRQAIQHFVDCVLQDREPLITGEDGLAITRTLCAVIEAAETGQAVELSW